MSDRKIHVYVEMQIRMIAIDFWASVEYEIYNIHLIINTAPFSIKPSSYLILGLNVLTPTVTFFCSCGGLFRLLSPGS
ncbi:hypothetical protein ACIQ4Z_18810 [Peribacillus asahii]|uniref:hypothetical protein n=1 Tax=Peribacillus asahii TaxID=228899 RepID=UPI0037F49850